MDKAVLGLRMVCDHLCALDKELTDAGIAVIYRNQQPWGSDGSHAWNRYACYFDLDAIRSRLNLPDFVIDWNYSDHWMGAERGFICEEHNDAIIGDPMISPDRPVIQ